MREIFNVITTLMKTEKWPPLISNLPSRGLIYPEPSFFAKTGKVVYRKFTGKTEEWASDPIFIGDPYYINFLLEEQIVLNEDAVKIPIEEFLVADRDIMIVIQRIMSYGNEIRGIQLHCRYCEEDIANTETSIERIEIESFEDFNIQPLDPNTNRFLYMVTDAKTKRKWRIVFKFPTVSDEKEIGMNSDGFSVMKYLNTIILEINGNRDKNAIEAVIAEELPFAQSRKFQQFVRKNTPSVKVHLTNIRCNHCGKENELKSRVGLELISINDRYIKDAAISEYHFLERTLRVPFDDIYMMPVEVRKRLVKKESDALAAEKKAQDERAGSKPSQTGAPRPMGG